MFVSKLECLPRILIDFAFRRNWQYHLSLSSKKNPNLLTIYLQSFKPSFLKSSYLWSCCLVMLLWLWSGVLWWHILRTNVAPQPSSLLFLLCCCCPRGLLQFWWFQNSPFVFQPCHSIYLDMLHMACLYSLVLLQRIPPVRMWSVRRLGRTVIKMALEADFCFRVNGISTGWSSVIERWSLAIKLPHPWLYLFLPHPQNSET